MLHSPESSRQPRTSIAIGVTAKDEEGGIGECLRSLLASVRYAEEHLPLRFEVVVVLDDCTDRTGEVARSFGVETLASSGGIVEAQRKLAGRPPFVIFSDADIGVSEACVAAVSRAMLDDHALQVAYPAKRSLPPRRRGLLASALYCYNRTDGFQTPRRYFNGRFFAIRDWRAPTSVELMPRLARLPPDRFYDFQAGMRVDDIWLSRDILRRYGPEAIREVSGGEVLFRPPETFEGMYRTYRRLRLETERLDALFPETREFHQRRGVDHGALRRAPWRDRALWRVFHLALLACRVRYRMERTYYRRLASRPCPAWPVVLESKLPAWSRSRIRK